MIQKIINKLNDLRPRQLLMLAGVAALLVFILNYAVMNFLRGEEVIPSEEKKPPAEMTQVVVAKVNIPPRTRIQESMLQLKEMPVDLIPEGSIKSFKDVVDVQVKVSIFSGDILTIQKVFAEKSDEGFIATIPLDSRAVSLSVNDITGVAGFAKPGDFVDLLLVEKSQYSATTSVLLQNVQLLSINKDMTGANVVTDGGVTTTTAINNPTIATFALKPEDVLKLVSASKIGEIYMSLRPTKPRNMYIGEMEYTLESINTPPPEPEPEPVYSPPPAPVENPLPLIPSNPTSVVPLPQLPATPATPKIEIIQGDQVTQEADKPTPPAMSMPMIPSGFEAPAADPYVATPPAASPPVVRNTNHSSNSNHSSANSSNITSAVSGTPLSNSRVAQSFTPNN